ncbi:MAG: hypothetical protein JNK76_00130 [Planctomycetales bacterium]|nr:hypothetical protein [Planctomycetales bacterium]
MRASPSDILKFDSYDIRVGLWTELVRFGDGVLVVKSTSYKRGRVVGIGFVIMFGMMVASSDGQVPSIAALIALILCCVVAYGVWRSTSGSGERLFLIEIGDVSNLKAIGIDVPRIQADDIRAVWFVENNWPDDGTFAQVYIELASESDAPRKLVYQHYWTFRRGVMEFAKELSVKVNKPLRLDTISADVPPK